MVADASANAAARARLRLRRRELAARRYDTVVRISTARKQCETGENNAKTAEPAQNTPGAALLSFRAGEVPDVSRRLYARKRRGVHRAARRRREIQPRAPAPNKPSAAGSGTGLTPSAPPAAPPAV